MASTSEDKEETIRNVFERCEKTVIDLTEGRLDMEQKKKAVPDLCAQLERLQKDISTAGLFADNEFVEELPPESVRLLLVGCYYAIAVQNTPFNAATRPDELKAAKTLLMAFLERLQSYEVINFKLPWAIEEDDEVSRADVKIFRATGEDLRKEKQRRYSYEKSLKEALATAERNRTINPEDDEALRELYMIQLRHWAMKALDELDSIEEELPMARMMAERAAAGITTDEPKPPPTKLKPFIIARNREQKRVFGLGYPSVPTLTVDEWAEGMMKGGSWGNSKPDPAAEAAAKAHADLDDPEMQDAVDPDEVRARQMNWDEYKDTHRRGWGNTHNKG